jgi:LPS sulfotransferase NodH
VTDTGIPFVLLSTQRNGSTWVMSVLNGFEDVAGHDELLLPRRRSPDRRWDSDFAYPRYVESAAEYGRVRPFSVFRYLDAFYRSPGTVGFKLMYSEVKRYPEVLPYLMRRRARVIHLVRRNHLDVLVSFEVKRALGQAHVLTTQERPPDVTVELETASLVKKLKRLQRKHELGRRLLRVCRLRHVEVVYEDLVRDETQFDRIRELLAIPADEPLPASHIVRSRRGRQGDVIENYDDVRRTLESSEFAVLLDDGS